MLFRIFKKLFLLFMFVLWVTGVVFLASCSYFFNNGNQDFRISYSSQSGSCVSKANKTIRDYFDRVHVPLVTEVQIDEFRVCYEQSIESFIKHTDSGRFDSKKYSSENIGLFLSKFYPEIKVNLKDIKYYLALKHFLMGGENDTVSKNELLFIKESLFAFSDLLKAVLPYRFIYFKKDNLDKNLENYKTFNLAFQILDEKLNYFIKNFERFNGRRDFNIRSLVRFFLDQVDYDSTKPFVYMDTIISFKNLVVPDEGDLLKRENLKTFINQSLLAYRGLMKFEYFVKENHLFNNIGDIASYLTKALHQLRYSEIFKTTTILRSISDILETSHQIFSSPIKLSPNGQLPYDKVNRLLVALEDAELLGERLTAGVLSHFMRGFSKKWLNPGSDETIHLTMAKITYIKDMYSVWIQRQQIINTLFSNPGVKTISFNEINHLKNYKPLKTWISILKNISVHQWLDNYQMILSREMDHFSYKELTLSNSILFLSEIFMKPYNLSVKSLQEYKLKREEIQEIYEIMRILGIPLGFMDSRLADSGYKVYDESNNFTTRGRNDGFVDLFEIYEYLSFALSSFQLTNQFYLDINDSCFLDYTDVHESPVINPLCFCNYLRENFDVSFKHLAVVSNFWKTASDVQKNKFMEMVKYVGQGGLLNDVPYKSGEIRTISVSLYYLESVFFTFDSNRDGIISGSELTNAYSHFKTPIKEFVFKKVLGVARDSEKTVKGLAWLCGTKEDDLEKITQCLTPRVFIFLLNRGELPTSGFYNGFAFFGEFMIQSEENLFKKAKASVYDVFRFFLVLSEDSHQALIDDMKVFLLENKDILYSELSLEQTPNCTDEKNKTSRFCQWAKLIRCNEAVKPHLYEWMKNNKYRLFSERLWDEPDRGVVEVMEIFDSSFRLHRRFSVQCGFPDFENDDTSHFFDFQWFTDWFEGDGEKKGFKDNFLEFWEELF